MRFPSRLHSAVFRIHSNQWRWRRSFRHGATIPIDRPIFLLGTQGAGLTLLSRILQRHSDIITATGNCRYWTGSDEAHSVLEEVLPPDFTWHHSLKREENHNSIFATDELLSLYARDGDDLDPTTAEQYREIVQGVLRMHGATSVDPKRFLDKSQTVSVRVGLFAAALKGCDPRFVLMVRNPFVMTWRSATGSRGVLGRLPLSEEERLTLAIEHWRNLHETALEQEGRVPMLVLRYEDFLDAPETSTRKVCDFAGLKFHSDLLPQPDDVMPLGSAPDARDGAKWYPIRPANNEKHLARLPDWAREHISTECGDLIERFGYQVDA